MGIVQVGDTESLAENFNLIFIGSIAIQIGAYCIQHGSLGLYSLLRVLELHKGCERPFAHIIQGFIRDVGQHAIVHTEVFRRIFENTDDAALLSVARLNDFSDCTLTSEK